MFVVTTDLTQQPVVAVCHSGYDSTQHVSQPASIHSFIDTLTAVDVYHVCAVCGTSCGI